MLAKRKGARREAGSEGSVEQTRDPMDKNRIRGRAVRTSGQETAKSISIKGRSCTFGGCAGKAAELTSGGLRRVPESGTEGAARFTDRGAEVSKGHSRRERRRPERKERRVGRATHG